ncbi:MAG: hypothetical protein GTN76_13780 [Candidatus Aenigmarchaeota archaeon]|nr:hypothetical protein [Candidatus Aenigmarchaeota archaeon]
MKIVCLECQREIGEKFPFDDTRVTHTFCHECNERKLMEVENEGLRGKFIRPFKRKVPLKFDPEADPLGR